jgi:hypothetical protein
VIQITLGGIQFSFSGEVGGKAILDASRPLRGDQIEVRSKYPLSNVNLRTGQREICRSRAGWRSWWTPEREAWTPWSGAVELFSLALRLPR